MSFFAMEIKFLIDFDCRATHGTREMSKEELSKCYGEENTWHEISLLKENPSQHCNYGYVFLCIFIQQ